MVERYSLNAETFNFVMEFERNISSGRQFTNHELVELFKESVFHKSDFDTYIKNAINKSIWFAIKRSGNWKLASKGVYERV